MEKKVVKKNGKNGKNKKLDELTLAKAMKTMFSEMKSGKTIYLAFSRVSFYSLVFTIAMSIISNIVLIDLLLRAPTVVERTNNFVFAGQFSLSFASIISGVWLFMKGVNIISEK